MVLVQWQLMLFKGMIVESKAKITLHYSRGVKRQQGFTAGVEFYVQNVIS